MSTSDADVLKDMDRSQYRPERVTWICREVRDRRKTFRSTSTFPVIRWRSGKPEIIVPIWAYNAEKIDFSGLMS